MGTIDVQLTAAGPWRAGRLMCLLSGLLAERGEAMFVRAPASPCALPALGSVLASQIIKIRAINKRMAAVICQK